MMRLLLLLCFLATSAGANESLETLCGDDRRCRLEQMELRQRERRIAQEKRRRELEQVEAKRLEELRKSLMPVREARRWSVDLMLNPVSLGGTVAGLASVHLTPRLRVEAMLALVSVQSYESSGYVSASGYMLGVRARWYFLLSETSPYLGLGAFGHSLSSYREQWSYEPEGPEEDPSGGYSFSSQTGEAHVGVAMLGLEHAFRNGFRLGAEIQLLKAFYVQAKDRESLLPDTKMRDSLQAAYDDNVVGAGFFAGWSF